MNNSGLPARIKIPFASTGSKNPIPEVSTGSMVTDGLAAMDTGFPSTTLTPKSAGGVPPHGEDMNGILNAITSKLQASDAGARYPFDATFATSIGGYPNGAVVMSSDLAGEWLNTTDANSTNPEGTATTSTGWVPLNFAGASAVFISTENITMPCLAAARPVLILSGELTGNRFLYIPNWAKHWTIINNCTGSYSVIVSTVSGVATAAIPSSTIANVYCDGNLNVTKLQSTQLASTTQAGIVQLNDTLTSTSVVQALTANQGKLLQDTKLNKTDIIAPGNPPLFACRAWVNFNGTGTVVILASGNVSSITDNGVGDYKINFTTQMVDNNYAASGSVSNRGSSDSQSVILSGLASNGVSVYCQYGGDNTAGRFDPTTVCVQVVR